MHTDIVFEPAEAEGQEFKVLYWKVEPGDRVESGAELVVLEAAEEKTALSVVAPASGVLSEIAAAEDATVRRGSVLGRIEAE